MRQRNMRFFAWSMFFALNRGTLQVNRL
jgi:hypothetical protein